MEEDYRNDDVTVGSVEVEENLSVFTVCYCNNYMDNNSCYFIYTFANTLYNTFYNVNQK